MESIQEVVADSSRRQAVIRDTETLIDEEVASKSGVTGIALKGGYAVVKKLKGGRMIPRAVDILLDDFAGALAPFQQRFESEGGSASFSAWLGRHDGEVAEALLAITDEKAKEADRGVLRKTYEKLRPTGLKHVQQAVPGIGRMVERQCG